MFLLDDTLVYSPSDLTQAATCEYALLRRLDEQLGRVPPAEPSDDPMLERTSAMGFAHEQRVLDAFVASHGAGVVQIARPQRSRAGYETARDQTMKALRDGAAVVAQGAFFDGRLLGFADFCVRVPADGTPAYQVLDAKLARSAKVSALLQLAAYADQLEAAGIPVAPEAGLVLGDGRRSDHCVGDIVPVYRERRRRLETLLDRQHASSATAVWGDPAFLSCGRCAACEPEVERTRDVLLVAGLRTSQRTLLRASGVETIDQLATSTGALEGMAARTLDTLRAQAAMQTGAATADGTVGDVSWTLHCPEHLATLPPPSEGDIFFDFEGDPLWVDDRSEDWGLEYLFGVLEPNPPGGSFTPFWAHDRVHEKQALLEFLAYVEARRVRFPDLHVYHYAAYEKSALLRLAVRHGVGEDAVDRLLREGVLVDLYATVRHCLRTSQRSYSLKKLEPLYMGSELRAGEVTDAGASIVVYQRYTDLREADDPGAPSVLDGIADYNQYDCLSTWRLRDWLLARGAEAGVHPTDRAVDAEAAVPEAIADPIADRLMALIDGIAPAERTSDQQAVAMVAAAVGYHRREHKPFWWGHFDRLAAPPGEWADTADTMLIDDAVVVESWAQVGRKSACRSLRLTGSVEAGSRLDAGDNLWTVYEAPLPDGFELTEGAVRAARQNTTLLECTSDDTGRDVLLVTERVPRGLAPWSQLPVALTPAGPPPVKSLEAAIHSIGEEVLRTWPALPEQPALDVLRRTGPRLTHDAALPAADDAGYATAITTAVQRLDRSYLAVQGPPGTGKTYVGSRVVAALVATGWRIGVVSQGHAAVEHFLGAVVEAGVAPGQVGKAPQATRGPSGAETWTVLGADAHAVFLDEHEDDGCVVGGTAWDFTSLRRFERTCLDLLVVDEAGQYSLADTLAVSVAAQRLLLLGDPQQLPQVSQGRHPEPVDGSALGWLSEGRRTLRPELGYFLERTWRMHPDLCAPVSVLSYDGLLHSQLPQTTDRCLDSIRPGVQVATVEHRGNAVRSVEEATEVVRQVRAHLGRAWRDVADTRALGEADLLVVAPYNAQVAAIRQALSADGLREVRVGTVDKFQGQQAPVVIVSMTASAADDVPRGMSFLLNRNRINVAISRGQWRTVLIRSAALTSYLPTTPAALAELGAFIRLCDSALPEARPAHRAGPA